MWGESNAQVGPAHCHGPGGEAGEEGGGDACSSHCSGGVRGKGKGRNAEAKETLEECYKQSAEVFK